jgi:hypothetical protein
MELSFVGISVAFILFFVAYILRGTLIIALMISLAFGATALMTLHSLGGSSPQIYTAFAAILILIVAARRSIWRDLGRIFGSVGPVWIISVLIVYTVIGAILFPRLFAGKVAVFVRQIDGNGVVESILSPVSSNISQSGYFLLGGTTALALTVLIMNSSRINQIRQGFLLWSFFHIAMGLIDFASKLIGAGDPLSAIRTANYVMLTQSTEAGFFRIAGAYSEASAFGAASLMALAFCYTYWRNTNNVHALGLSIVLVILLVFSTSSTAYFGLFIISIPAGVTIVKNLLFGRIERVDIIIVSLFLLMILVIIAVVLLNEDYYASFTKLIETAVINKAGSSSGQERMYWNMKSLQAVLDTGFLGIGIGSSRASSWPVAVLCSLLMGAAAFVVLRGLGSLSIWVDRETEAVVASVRACALASLVAASLASGTADPGMFFFIAFAVVAATRAIARANRGNGLVPATRPARESSTEAELPRNTWKPLPS